MCIGGVCACCDPSYHIEVEGLIAMGVHLSGTQGRGHVHALTHLAMLSLKVDGYECPF